MSDVLSAIFNWSTFWWFLLILYIPASIGLIIIVLLQKGKGVGFGGAFGMGGGGDAVFGPRTSRSLPQKLTYTMAGVFMIMALLMSIISGRATRGAAPTLDPEDQPIQSEQLDALFGGEGETEGEEAAAAEGEVAPAEGEEAAEETPTPVEDLTLDDVIEDAKGDAKEEELPGDESAIGTEVGTIEEEAVEAMTEEAPAEETTEEPAPAAEAPAEEAPAEEAPAEEGPAEEGPAEAPVEEAPTEAAPADETPAEETPTEESPEEQNTNQ